MSQTLGQTMLVWQDVSDNLRRKCVSWQGSPLSERDLHTFTDAIVMCAIHLTDIRSQFDRIGTDREIIAWANFVCTLDVSLFGSFLSDVVTELRRVSSSTTLRQFKRCLCDQYPMVGMLILPIRVVLEEFLECPSSRSFRPIYQFFSFLTHVSLLDLKIDLEDAYKELEETLRTYSYPPAYIEEMNAIMKEWMVDFRITETNLLPQHGPGSTVETRRSAATIEKYQYLGTDQLLTYVFEKFAGVSVESYYPLPLSKWHRESKLVFVPKSMKTRRAISQEPATLQFWQQAVSKIMDKYIHTHPFLSRRVNLHEQQINGDLAVAGSGTRKWATIDLSSASDTVTYTLVKAVFKGTPVYPFLVALRSRTVRLPSGEVLDMEKYAPMGSALCFPVETLIFSCAVELAVRRAFREGLGLHPYYRVYGDDIIVPDVMFDDVKRVLQSLGFVLNESKSFGHETRFRESCGSDGYDGELVTPLKISRNFYSPPDRWTSSHAALYSGLMQLANNCQLYNFRLLRAWIIRSLLRGSDYPPLFSESGDGCVYSPMPDNYRARWRLSPSKRDWYQREEVLINRTGSKIKKISSFPGNEEARLFETLRLTSNREGDMFDPASLVSVPCGPSVSLLSKRWVNNPTSRLTVEQLKSQLFDNQGGEAVPTQ